MTTEGAQPSAPSGMYLSELSIRGFRSCANVEVPLSPNVTLLVGENNSGKSNVIEALRLSTAPLSGRRSRHFEAADVTRGHDGPVVISSRFTDLTRFQRAHFIGALELDQGEAIYCTRFRPPADGATKSRVEQLVGTTQAQDPEPDKREQINHVYLTPLRDAQTELDSYSGTRLARIIQHLTAPAEQQNFVDTAVQAMNELAGHQVVRQVQAAIQEHLTGLTAPGREQVMDAAYDPPELARLARSLRLKMAEAGLDVTDLSESGLGYANLLFMATVILELQKSKESELTLFLVEEPEAHLHPQLQSVLLQFLADQAAASVEDDIARPAGRIQVVATTHSPALASAVGIENVVVLRPRQLNADARLAATCVIPLAKLPLDSSEQRKINQYLDASRSELLFARRAVFVEGIAEAVLLPVLARRCIYAGDQAEAASARRAFAGASVINVGSVDFKPYLKLLLGEVGGHRLADALVVITDADPALVEADEDDDQSAAEADVNGGASATGLVLSEQAPANEPGAAGLREGIPDEGDTAEEESTGGVPYNRARDLAALAASLGASELVHIAEAPHTLEADLLAPGQDNRILLGKAYICQKPRSAKMWKSIIEARDPAEAFYAKLQTSKRHVGKGEFAHDVARLIEEGDPFTCPDYLDAAIRFITTTPS